MSTKLQFTTVFVVCLATKVALGPSLPSLTCSKFCKCEVDTNQTITAKCNLSGLNSSTLMDIQWPQDLFSLDLSTSGLKELPTSFTRKLSNISELDLSNNSLEDMTTESFDELKELRTLNLSYSKFVPLELLSNTLSKLKTLYVKGSYLSYNSNWPKILSLPSIKTVRDVGWLDACDQCNITRTIKPNTTYFPNKNYSRTRFVYTQGRTSEDSSSSSICRSFGSYTNALIESLGFLKPGFAFECWCDLRRCAAIVEEMREWLKRLNLRALRLIPRLLDCLYPLASVALVFNFTVISFILTSKDLRKSPTMLLILNMAVCDVFMTIWCILTATYNSFVDGDEDVKNYYLKTWTDLASAEKYCPYMAFIYGVTQTAMVVTSVFLVVEKYLVIVYSTRPGVRLTKRITNLSIVIIWCVAVIYFVYAVFLVNKDQKLEDFHHNHYLCTVYVSGELITEAPLPELKLSVFLGWVGFLLFLLSIPLYIHIYIVVRKSSNQMGIKREGTLAKRLAVLILTNFLFSTVPLSIIPFYSSQVSIGVRVQETTLVVFVWTPVLLLCLNSCLNPYLFAFRNYLFQQHFFKTVRKTFQWFQNQPKQNNDQQMCQLRGCNRVAAKDTDASSS